MSAATKGAGHDPRAFGSAWTLGAWGPGAHIQLHWQMADHMTGHRPDSARMGTTTTALLQEWGRGLRTTVHRIRAEPAARPWAAADAGWLAPS
jgi:hypothetical protein